MSRYVALDPETVLNSFLHEDDAKAFIRRRGGNMVLAKVVSAPEKPEQVHMQWSQQEIDDHNREVEASKLAWAKSNNQD